MAVEEYTAPWLYIHTAVSKGNQIWFCRNPVAWTDIQANAQNQADQSGRPQYVVKGDGEHYITHVITPNERRTAALRRPI